MQNTEWFNFSKFYDFIASNPMYKTYVELGVWMGGSIAYLAKKLRYRKNEVTIYGVDLFENWETNNNDIKNMVPNIYNEYNKYLITENVRDMIIDMKGISWETANQFEDNSIDFVFVDADHTYDSVMKDIKAWYPKIKPNGIIAGHDIHVSDVINAVKENFPDAKFRSDLGGIWVHKKEK